MSHQLKTDFDLSYWLYLPQSYAEKRDWPLILFLHGSGERGNEPELVKKYGLAFWIDREENFPFVVVSPQCPAEVRWIDLVEKLDTLLDHILHTYAIARSRVYLTGLSMGGQGAWCLAAHHPERFAAVVPICGRIFPDYETTLCALKNVPVWVFHGEQDKAVWVKNSHQMVDLLRACGGNVRLTIFPDADHFCWDRVYTNPDFYAFFGSDWQSFS